MPREIETYVTRIATDNRSIFFYTQLCKNRMYYIDYDPTHWDGCICPKCGRTLKFEKEDISLEDVL